MVMGLTEFHHYIIDIIFEALIQHNVKDGSIARW